MLFGRPGIFSIISKSPSDFFFIGSPPRENTATQHKCFSDCVKIDVFQTELAKTGTRFKNTLIGLVEKR
jgi:hypothetical protein